MSDRLLELRQEYTERVEILEDEKEAIGEFWETVDQLELDLTKSFLDDLLA